MSKKEPINQVQNHNGAQNLNGTQNFNGVDKFFLLGVIILQMVGIAMVQSYSFIKFEYNHL